MGIEDLFEWDDNKSRVNLEKHGAAFADITVIWEDPYRAEFDLDYQGERRYAVVGMFRERLWTAIVTDRGSKIRLISARRAHKDEEDIYHENGRY